jgi:hypothetical protein
MEAKIINQGYKGMLWNQSTFHFFILFDSFENLHPCTHSITVCFIRDQLTLNHFLQNRMAYNLLIAMETELNKKVDNKQKHQTNKYINKLSLYNK